MGWVGLARLDWTGLDGAHIYTDGRTKSAGLFFFPLFGSILVIIFFLHQNGWAGQRGGVDRCLEFRLSSVSIFEFTWLTDFDLIRFFCLSFLLRGNI